MSNHNLRSLPPILRGKHPRAASAFTPENLLREARRHKRLPEIYALGDACSAPTAKTAAAARKQAPVVAHNLLVDMGYLHESEVAYDGYGSCPLTVERGRILLAEFGTGGSCCRAFPPGSSTERSPAARLGF